MVYKGILFDFDGVIGHVNIEQVLRKSMLLREHFRLPPEEILDRYFYHNPFNTCLDLGEVTVETVRESFRERIWIGESQSYQNWWQSVEDAYALTDSMHKLLAQLRGKYQLVLVTDNHLGFRDWLERRADINIYFDALVCSAELGIKKPNPAIYEKAVRHIDASFREVVYVDDHMENTNAAIQMGITSIYFESDELLLEQLFEQLK